MGICCGAEENKSSRERPGNKQNNHKLEQADLNSSMQANLKNIDSRIKILQRGIEQELEHMIKNYDENINEYSFGQNKTLLLEAVIKCPNEKVIDMIMKKGADVNLPELQTGNTAIFLCALDLKVEFVKALLKYNPDLNHVNKSKQNIFEFLQYQLFEQRKNLGREMVRQEKEKYEIIHFLLKEYVGGK